MTPPVLEKDKTFYCTLISIQVENCLFRVPREPFELYSEVFQDMFSLPCVGESNEAQDGDLDEKPLFLDGIKKVDFRAFLTALCALHYEKVSNEKIAGKTNLLLARFPHQPSYNMLATSQWIAALRLSHKWGFEIVKARAIAVLEGTSAFGWIDRLKLGQELEIPAWIRAAYRYLVKREEGLSVDEVSWMAYASDLIQKVKKAREERTKLFLARILSQEIPIPLCPFCRTRTLRLITPGPSSSPPKMSSGSSNSPSASPESWTYTFWCTEYQQYVHQINGALSRVAAIAKGQNNAANQGESKDLWTLEDLYHIQLATELSNVLKDDIDRVVNQFLPSS